MKTVRIALPGKNVRSTDRRDFSLIADEDNILLKEAYRGAVAAGGTVDHNLGYIPFFLTYGDVGGGKYQLATGFDAVSGVPRTKTTINTLTFSGGLGGGAGKYFIFYDNMN